MELPLTLSNNEGMLLIAAADKLDLNSSEKIELQSKVTKLLEQHYEKLADEIKKGTFIIFHGHQLRIDAHDPKQLFLDSEDNCLFVHDEDSGEEQHFNFLELNELYANGKIQFKRLI